MPLMTHPSSAAKTSLAYITIGSLVMVWTAIWYWYLRASPEGVMLRTWYICTGLFISGAVLLVIGLAVGQIGRSARHAELPPPEVTQQEAKIDQTAAARPIIATPAPPVVPVQPTAPPVVPTQSVPAPPTPARQV